MTPAKLNALAHRLAKDHAILVLESDCMPAGGSYAASQGWFDTSRHPDANAGEVNRAVKYLDARKLLVRDPKRREVVRIKGRR